VTDAWTEGHTKSVFDIPESVDDPAWAAKRRLAAATRKLVALTTGTRGAAAPLNDAAALVESAVSSIEGEPWTTFGKGLKDGSAVAEPSRFADQGAIMGLGNPLAPPVTLQIEDGVVRGHATFSVAYEGPPGYVHGGLVAAVMDQVLGYVMVTRGVGGMTKTLTIHYERPTPIEARIDFEGRWIERDGKKLVIEGHAAHDGKITAKAECVFVTLGSRRLQSLFGG